MSYTELVERIIEDGKLTVNEYKDLLETANEDGLIVSWFSVNRNLSAIC
ncbi:MAG: hypothetical protein GY775_20205 [Candidatus Scalindua sp.]|nr:hypothetical protein [Candidatus Scalindua sp.]